MTRCADCKQDLSPRHFSKRPNGTPIAYCKSCACVRWRGYRNRKPATPNQEGR